MLKHLFTKKRGRPLAFDYQIRRSRRAKKTRIVVTGDKIEVVAPPKVTEQQIHGFVCAQQDWVREAVKKMQCRGETIKSMAPAHYGHGVKVPFKGQHFLLSVKPASVRRTRIDFERELGFSVQLPSQLDGETSELISRGVDQMDEGAGQKGGDPLRGKTRPKAPALSPFYTH
nr:YgjP-like metallopeptidase domain-containing protein [Methylomarinum sp. Ch1-1]MDP4519389.1 DUF45 domain-containing protein [Methylomarinum sp. Ch1-1]